MTVRWPALARAVSAASILAAMAGASPAAASGGVVSGFDGSILSTGAYLFFDRGSAVLPTVGERDLLRLMPQLRAGLAAQPAAERRLCVSGHTDEAGPEAGTPELAEARARAVASRLMDHGLPPAQIVTRGFGARRPLRPGTDPELDGLNRFVRIGLAGYCHD